VNRQQLLRRLDKAWIAFKDSYAHLPAVLEGKTPPRYSVTYGGIDAFNAVMTKKKAGWSLAEVYRRQEDIHRQIIDTGRVDSGRSVDSRDPLSPPAAPRYLRPLSQTY